MMPYDDPSRDEDARLLAAYAAGDANAARALIEAHSPGVLRLARRALGDQIEAEDVTQEAMLRLWKIAPEWRSGEARVSTWLYRVATNLCTDRLRKRKYSSDAEVPEVEDGKPSADSQLEDAERTSALDKALNSLPDNQRMAVTLRHLEERSNPDIAEIMAITVEAVESLIARGKRGLKQRLADKSASLGYKDD